MGGCATCGTAYRNISAPETLRPDERPPTPLHSYRPTLRWLDQHIPLSWQRLAASGTPFERWYPGLTWFKVGCARCL